MRPYYFGRPPPPPPPPPPPSPVIHGSNHCSGGTYGHVYGVSDAVGCVRPDNSSYSTYRNEVRQGNKNDYSNTNNTKNENRSEKSQLVKSEVLNHPPGVLTNESEKCPQVISSTMTTKSSNTWECEACKITLESEKALKSHLKCHVKCSACSFEGAPKVVKAHYQAKHGKFSGSGFKTIKMAIPGCRVQRFKICVGNRPEDIKRWIAERKRRFPRSISKDKNTCDDTTEAKSSLFNSTTGEKKTSSAIGLSSLLAGYGSSDDDDSENDGDELPSSTQSCSNPIVSKSENSPHLNVNNCDETVVSKNEVESNNKYISKPPTDNTKVDKQEQQHKISRPCRFYFRRGFCRNGISCRFSHEVEGSEQQSYQLSTTRTSNCKNNKKKHKRGGHTSSDTLLRKLLQNDMERESTLSMQLLKYIVDNNFFFEEDESNNKKRKKCATDRVTIGC